MQFFLNFTAAKPSFCGKRRLKTGIILPAMVFTARS